MVLCAPFLMLSCVDDDIDPNPNPEDGKADYTVIFWGMTGGVDAMVGYDLCQLAYNFEQGAIGPNVNMVGLIKTSMALEGSKKYSTFDKTYYFSSDDIKSHNITEEMTEVTDLDAVKPSDTKKQYDAAFKTLHAKEYAGKDYDLSSVDNLANFIKEAAETHPAHHYVLMLLGHGGGFSPIDDKPSSRSCVIDSYNNEASLSADAIAHAVEKSGVKIQTLFTQCCLMSTLENMAAYSKCFDYAFLSAETTMSFYFPQYLVELSQAGDNEAEMVKHSQALMDYYVKRINTISYGDYTSHGFYDLRKMPQLMAEVKKASAWFDKNYEVFENQIKDGLSNSIFCTNVTEEDTMLRRCRAYIQGLDDDVEDELEIDQFIEMMAQLTHEGVTYGFPFAHVMAMTLKAGAGIPEFAELQKIYENYMSILKSMAYIRTTMKPADAEADYEFLYASPTILVFSLDKACYKPLPEIKENDVKALAEAFENDDDEEIAILIDKYFGGTQFANLGSYELALSNYTSSDFDKEVQWSKFLKKLDYNPSFLLNPDRMEVSVKK